MTYNILFHLLSLFLGHVFDRLNRFLLNNASQQKVVKKCTSLKEVVSLEFDSASVGAAFSLPGTIMTSLESLC